MPKPEGAKVVHLRLQEPDDIFSVFRRWGYEICVGGEFCKGDGLEAVRCLRGEAERAVDGAAGEFHWETVPES